MLNLPFGERPPKTTMRLFSFDSLTTIRCGPPQQPSRPRRRLLPVLHRDLPVDDDIFDAYRELSRLLVGRAVGDRLRIEDNHVGGEALTQLTPAGEVHSTRRKRGHLAHSFLQREQALLPHVFAQHTRDGAVDTRVRLAA